MGSEDPKMRKLVFVLAALLIAHVLLTALGNGAVAQKGKPKVGLVTTEGGKINDGTFNELAYKGMMRAVDKFELQGTFIRRTVLLHAANEGVSMAPYHDADRAIPRSVKEKIAEVVEGLKTGKIKTGVK